MNKVINLFEAKFDLTECVNQFISNIQPMPDVEIFIWEHHSPNSVMLFFPELIGENMPNIFYHLDFSGHDYTMSLGPGDEKVTIYIIGLEKYEGLILSILLMEIIFSCSVSFILDKIKQDSDAPAFLYCKDHDLYKSFIEKNLSNQN